MRNGFHLGAWPASLVVVFFLQPIARAYVDAPPATFGRICEWSTHAIEVEVQSVDGKRHVIVWRKLAELKGRWPGGGETVRQDLSPLPEPARSNALRWAQAGRQTVMFALESYRWSHTYIDGLWYASQTNDWKNWNANRLMPLMLRSYCGPTARLAGAARGVLAGRTVVVACQIDPSKGAPKDRPRIASLHASLKRLDYQLARDLAHMGAEDFTRLLGMPQFNRYAILPSVGPGARSAEIADFLSNGRPGVVMAGDGHVALLGNADNALSDCDIPGLTIGARSASWADFDHDGKPDLLLATAEGPKLYHNDGGGKFTNVTARIPKLPYWDVTATAWIDVDGTGWPDILVADAYRGLRLLKNRAGDAPGTPPISAAYAFEDVSDRIGLGDAGACGQMRVEWLAVGNFSGNGRADVLVGAEQGVLLANTPGGFRAVGDCGLRFDPRGVMPAAADVNHCGATSVFVPQRDGRSKLFANDGKGHFADVTEHSGDLSRPMGIATCAAWGELMRPGRLCLVVGCDRSPNRLFERQPDGTFLDLTDSSGLQKRVFNTRAIAVADFDGDGALDLLFNNEGQDSILLLGNPAAR